MEDNKQRGYNKKYFPKVAEGSHTKIKLTQNFTTTVTGHRNIKSHLHRFKTIDTPHCPWGDGNQTTDRILLECAILQEERERPIAEVAKADDWPIKKEMLIKNHYKAFAKFTNKLDKIKEVNT
jgi:hypothetical protein